MTKASDNAFPSILVTEGTEPSAPAAGKQRLYIDSTSHHLKRTDSSGTDVDLETNQSSGSVATDAIWDAAGDLAVGTGANTAAKLSLGGVGKVLGSDGSTAAWTYPILALKVHAPVGGTTYQTNSATFADVDATNAIVTFTAPASGNVIVRVSAWVDCASNATAYFWGLRESTTNIAGTITRVQRSDAPGQQYASVPMYVSGISAGSHSYKLSHAVGSGGAGNGRTIVAEGPTTPTWGPLIMEVWAAP